MHSWFKDSNWIKKNSVFGDEKRGFERDLCTQNEHLIAKVYKLFVENKSGGQIC